MGIDRAVRLFSVIAIASLACGNLFAAENPPRPSSTSTKIDASIEAMMSFTDTPYQFDMNYELMGRTELQQVAWSNLAATLFKDISSVDQSEVTDQEIDGLVKQLRDPFSWENEDIEMALAHIGPRAVIKVVDYIFATPDAYYAEHISRSLVSVIGDMQMSAIDEPTIDKIVSGFNYGDQAVRINFARAFAPIGPRAQRALPALEREFQRARERDLMDWKANGMWLGPTGEDIVRWSIEAITGMEYMPKVRLF